MRPLISVQPRMPAKVEGSLPTSVESQAAAFQQQQPVESPMQWGSGGAATQDALQQQQHQQDQQAARQSGGPEASAATASAAPTHSSANGALTPQAAAGAPKHPALTQLLPAGSAEQPQVPGAAKPAPQAQQHTFRRATKEITTEQQLQAFLASPAVRSFVGFILSLNEAVHGQRLSHPCPVSEVAQGLVADLQRLSQWVDDIPPVKQVGRVAGRWEPGADESRPLLAWPPAKAQAPHESCRLWLLLREMSAWTAHQLHTWELACRSDQPDRCEVCSKLHRSQVTERWPLPDRQRAPPPPACRRCVMATLPSGTGTRAWWRRPSP